MKKGFTILELLIAFLVSVFVIITVYNMLNSTLNVAASSDLESKKLNFKYNLQRLIIDDITSLTSKRAEKVNSFNDSTFSFTTMNSLILNKTIPVTVTYQLSNETLYRIEENASLNIYEKFLIGSNIKKFEILNFQNEEYLKDFSSINILKFIIKTDIDEFYIIAGNFKNDK